MNNNDWIPEDIFQLMEYMRSMSGLYITAGTIDRLEAFLSGWLLAQPSSDLSVQTWKGFCSWIYAKYAHPSKGWAQIIRFNSANELDAFDETLRLFEEYVLENHPEKFSK